MNCIELTVGVLDRKIVALQRLRGEVLALAREETIGLEAADLPRGTALGRNSFADVDPDEPLPIKLTAKGERQVKKFRKNRQPRTSNTELTELLLSLREPFGAEEVMTHGEVERKKASNILTQWKLKKLVKTVSYGKYERTAKAGKGDAVAEPPKGGTPNPAPAAPARTGANFAVPQPREGKLIDVMRACAGSLKTFLRAQIRDLVSEKMPEIEARQLYQVGNNLILMLERGELTREGVGSEAVYTVAALRQ